MLIFVVRKATTGPQGLTVANVSFKTDGVRKTTQALTFRRFSTLVSTYCCNSTLRTITCYNTNMRHLRFSQRYCCGFRSTGWDAVSCRLFDGSYCLHLQMSSRQRTALHSNIRAPLCFERPGTNHATTHGHGSCIIPCHPILQQCTIRQQVLFYRANSSMMTAPGLSAC